MATATQIAERALKRLGIVDSLHSPSAADSEHTIEALNAMIESWDAEGLSFATPADDLPLDPKYEAGLIAMLAVRMAEDFGLTPGPVLVRDADRGWAQLQAAYITPPAVEFDRALTRTASRFNVDNAYSISENSPWQANTAFGLADLVTNSGNIYVCIVAGTSGTTGPTGTALGQTDGTVTWDYVQAIAT